MPVLGMIGTGLDNARQGSNMAHQTPLYQEHLISGAKMTDFQNWSLPLNFGSQIDEHNAVRTQAGIFDVSHMLITDISGAQTKAFLQFLLANNIDKLTQAGKALYTVMLNDAGGIIDDLIVYFLAEGQYRIISNAGTRMRVTQWLEQHAQKFDCTCQIREDLALIAVQGPQTTSIVCDVLQSTQANHCLQQLKPFHTCTLDTWCIAATGYTGEAGFEIMLPATDAVSFWRNCCTAGAMPCGLGARDTLRLEAGLCLYGHEMNEETSPLISGLGWTVAFEPSSRDFIGKAALLADQNPSQKLVGLVMTDRGVMRPQMSLYTAPNNTSELAGSITSGGFSPSLECSIALARIQTQSPEYLFIQLRQGWVKVKVTPPAFFRRGKALIDVGRN